VTKEGKGDTKSGGHTAGRFLFSQPRVSEAAKGRSARSSFSLQLSTGEERGRKKRQPINHSVTILDGTLSPSSLPRRYVQRDNQRKNRGGIGGKKKKQREEKRKSAAAPAATASSQHHYLQVSSGSRREKEGKEKVKRKKRSLSLQYRCTPAARSSPVAAGEGEKRKGEKRFKKEKKGQADGSGRRLKTWAL